MSDVLLDLSKNPNARRLIKQLGLPIPMPQALRRAKGPYEERPLMDMDVVVGFGPSPDMAESLAEALAPAGANPWVVSLGDSFDALTPFIGPGEAFGRPPVKLPAGDPPENATADALVLDATGITSITELRGLYDFFHPWMRRLSKNGRLLVLGRPPADQKNVGAAAAQAALSGFARSAAKEVGKRGSTAHVVYIEVGAEDRAAGVLRFLLSKRSAFISGQPFHVTKRAKKAPAQQWTRPLEGKTALVTGAARGIGKATAAALAAEGAHVICLDRPDDDGPASQVARDVGGSVLLVDVTASDAGDKIAAAAATQGGLDIVVHNAGVTRDKTLANMKPGWWDLTLQVNLEAVADITTKLLDEGALNAGGRVICLSSVAGISGNMGQTNYAASKSGVIGYVRALAGALEKQGITVNAIAPGFIETRLTDAMPVAVREVARRFNSLSQGGRPSDVADAITFLATPGAHGLTGEVVRVCGQNMVGA